MEVDLRVGSWRTAGNTDEDHDGGEGEAENIQYSGSGGSYKPNFKSDTKVTPRR